MSSSLSVLLSDDLSSCAMSGCISLGAARWLGYECFSNIWKDIMCKSFKVPSWKKLGTSWIFIFGRKCWDNELFGQFILLSGYKIYSFFLQKYTSQTKCIFGLPSNQSIWVYHYITNYIMVGTSGDLNVFVEQDISHLLRKCLWLSSLPVPHLEQLRSVLHLTQLKVGLQVQHPRPGDIFSIDVIGWYPG